MPAARLLVGSAAACLLLTGCVGVPAAVPVYKPPESELSDVRTIEVETFTVAESVAKQSGENVSGPLKHELQKTKRFTVVDRVDLKRIREIQSARDEGLIAAGTEPGERAKPQAPDAVLRGNVVAYKCESSQPLSGAGAGSVVHEIAFDPLTLALRQIKGFKQEELVQLEGSVALTFQLVDARTGVVRASGEAMHTRRQLYLRQLASGGEQDRLLRELLRLCVVDVANKLARHREVEVVRFMDGTEKVNAGIEAARKGEWPAARALWEAALAENPADDAAAFNLGHAHRAVMEPEKALELFRRAQALKPSPLYAAAVESAEAGRRELAARELEFAPGGAKVNRGIAFAKEGDWAYAEAAWREAVADDASDHAALFNLGLARREQGQPAEGAAFLAKARDLQAGNALYARELARATAAPARVAPKAPATDAGVVPASLTVPAP